MAAPSHKRLCAHLREMLAPGTETEAALSAARRKASLLAQGIEDPRAAGALKSYAFVGGTIGMLALARPWTAEEIASLSGHVAREAGDDTTTAEHELFRRAMEGVEEAGFAGSLALRAALTMLRAFAPVGEASLWATAEPGALQCLTIVGAEQPSRRVQAAARETLLTGRDRLCARALVSSIALSRWERPLAALVFRARPADRARILARSREAARYLTATVERASLLSRNALREKTLLEASERRLSRLGYDIHDGPIQDLSMLAGDVRLLRRQLERGLLIDAPREVLVGRLDDFDARLNGLDRELRELALSLDRAGATDLPLAEALRRQIAALRFRKNVAVRLDLRGESDLTSSQRLALLALVREGLVNVREHSGATEVRIRVAINKQRTVASVEDNGRGFEVERVLARASRRGRLGLAGLGERIRLLGGWLALDSSPGGPTRLQVVLPQWEQTGSDGRSVRAA
jgi:signal transduction histidine kinase